MARYFIIILTGCLVLCACHSYSGDHIPEKTMEKVLFDINLAEAYSAYARDTHHIMGAKNTDSLSRYYQQVFDHYHISRDEFTESMKWYKSHPDDLDTIYNNLLTRIGKEQTALLKSGLK